VLCCFIIIIFLRSYKNCTFITPMAYIRVTSVIDTLQRRLNSKPYFLPRQGARRWPPAVLLISCFLHSCSRFSILNFMQELFLTYIFCAYEHDRGHMGLCEGIPQSLLLDGGLHYLTHYLFVAGCRSDNMNRFINFIDIVATMDWSATLPIRGCHVATKLTVAPLFTSVQPPTTTRKLEACTSARMT
jgi:hypothetical protein